MSLAKDALGRGIAAADYGTNGGAVLARPSVPPSTGEEVLVTITRHASTGEPGAVIDPMGTETRWKRDAIGRETETIENFKEGAAPAADVNRTTRFAYHASGGLEILTLVNEVTGDQNTRWVYGTTLTDSGVATGHLLRAKIYPESDDSNAPLGNGPDGVYERTELGRILHDRITAFGAGIDQTVKRISITYEVSTPTTGRAKSSRRKTRMKRSTSTTATHLPVLTITEIVDEYCGGVYPELLTLDLEGLDLPVLATADFSRSHPIVVVAELRGAEAEESRALMDRWGFRVLCRMMANLIFVHEDWIGKLS